LNFFSSSVSNFQFIEHCFCFVSIKFNSIQFNTIQWQVHPKPLSLLPVLVVAQVLFS